MDSSIERLKLLIENSTNLNLTEPNEDLFLKVCQAIKTRADLPKEAIKIIKKRLQIQNGKVLFELLEMATFYCDLPFQTQIASKDFLTQINTLFCITKLPPHLLDKLISLVSLWNKVFSSQKDILPLFFTFLESLKKKKPDLEFPPAGTSKYEKYSNQQYSYQQPQPQEDIKYQPQQHHQERREVHAEKNKPKRPDPNSKAGKLYNDLEQVQENLFLLNQIIDGHDPSENVKNNDVLIDLINSLTTTERKVESVISNKALNDKDLMNFCLALNEDIQSTMDRYNLLSAGKKPSSFKAKSGKQYQQPQPIASPPPKQKSSLYFDQQPDDQFFKPIEQPTFLQQQQQPSQQSQQRIQEFWQQEEKKQEPKPEPQIQQQPAAKTVELVNLLDDDEEDEESNQIPQQSSQQKQAPPMFNLFDDNKQQQVNQPQQQQQQFQQNTLLSTEIPSQQQQAPIYKQPTNSIADQISSLYIQQPQQSQPQASQLPQMSQVPQMQQSLPYNMQQQFPQQQQQQQQQFYPPQQTYQQQNPNQFGMPNMTRTMPYQQMPMQQPMQSSMQQPMQSSMQQPMQQPMQQSMQSPMPQAPYQQIPGSMQYSYNQPQQQYGLSELNKKDSKPFDQLDDMFGLDFKK